MWINEGQIACAELLCAHDVSRITRRPRWALELLSLAGRFPRKTRFHGRPVGWLRRDILEWMAGRLEVSESPTRTAEAGDPGTARSPCRHTHFQRTGPCATSLRSNRTSPPPRAPIGSELDP